MVRLKCNYVISLALLIAVLPERLFENCLRIKCILRKSIKIDLFSNLWFLEVFNIAKNDP